ncbi:hypothetical protein FAF44_43295 [Nonomuraea sp. MG754425]|uniref:hypothetical protein n=1 Tax=Nonomuraea sp. MG754425 TaxID=2570319 RepID=UPI001F21076E|nr:hypothetical protein [Nonomuraea sp. MG754425]MCF6475151.1 hypothetical protein [Nonomuraea sp. MG754425]
MRSFQRIAALAIAAAVLAVPAQAALAGTQATPEPVKLTCVAWGGGLQNENWDILVQLNPDGTATSAEQQGDAYMTGIGIFSVQRTDPAKITISADGRELKFYGTSLISAGLGDFSYTNSGTCRATFTFPNPAKAVVNLTPTS